MMIAMLMIISNFISAVATSSLIHNESPTMKMDDFSRRGLPDFKLQGDSLLFGLWSYSSLVYIGNPPKLFRMVIDTGSDVSWISCTPSETNDILVTYDLKKSTTGSAILCGDSKCQSLNKSNNCREPNELCPFSITYEDNTTASGYFVSDVLYYNTTGKNATSGKSSTHFIFGCAIETKGFEYTDGLFGLSPEGASMIIQMHSQEKSPLVFSHCLKGEINSGGYLMFGQPEDPIFTSTPFIPSQPNYYVNLEGISVNGKALPISSNAFSFSKGRGTIIDSGTTVPTLVAEAFEPLIAEISKTKSLFRASWSDGDDFCYNVKEVVSLDIFPTIELKFAGGASLLLRPAEYLIEDGAGLMCVGFERSQGLNILGDTVLKDRIIIYDLSSRRIGWSDQYNCSIHPNMTFSYKPVSYKSGHDNKMASLHPALIAIIFVHVHAVLICYIVKFFSPMSY